MKNYARLFLIFLVFCFAFYFSTPAQSSDFSNCISKKQSVTASIRLAKKITGNDALKCISASRDHLFDDIYKYSYIIQTGPETHDRIGLYRVVKEKRYLKPIKAKKAVFMIHGDYSSFDLFIMQSENVPEDHSIGIFLAQKDIDVWGIDLRWALLPDDTEDFSFMKDWNTQTHLSDIKIAVKLARTIRLLTGSGFGKIILSGFSRGVQYVYAYANDQSQLPLFLQDIKAIIPIDAQFKADPDNDEIIEAAIGRYEVLKSLYEGGMYYSDEGIGLKYMAFLALNAPEEPSEIISGLKNKQAILLIATATFMTFEDPEGPYTPYYHFTGGIFDDYDLPYDLGFTKYAYLLDIVLGIPGYQSLGEIIEGEAILADIEDVPYDDHLEDITIPVLYVGAAGGEGEYGEYTLSLIGSKDKTSLIVGLYPPEYIAADFGHLDLLSADDADTLVWEPMYQWIKSH